VRPERSSVGLAAPEVARRDTMRRLSTNGDLWWTSTSALASATPRTSAGTRSESGSFAATTIGLTLPATISRGPTPPRWRRQSHDQLNLGFCLMHQPPDHAAAALELDFFREAPCPLTSQSSLVGLYSPPTPYPCPNRSSPGPCSHTS